MTVRSGLRTRENFKEWLVQVKSRAEILELARQSAGDKLAPGLKNPFRLLLAQASVDTLAEQVARSVEDYSFFPDFLDWCRQCEEEEDPYAAHGVMERDFVGIS